MHSPNYIIYFLHFRFVCLRAGAHHRHQAETHQAAAAAASSPPAAARLQGEATNGQMRQVQRLQRDGRLWQMRKLQGQDQVWRAQHQETMLRVSTFDFLHGGRFFAEFCKGRRIEVRSFIKRFIKNNQYAHNKMETARH